MRLPLSRIRALELALVQLETTQAAAATTPGMLPRGPIDVETLPEDLKRQVEARGGWPSIGGDKQQYIEACKFWYRIGCELRSRGWCPDRKSGTRS